MQMGNPRRDPEALSQLLHLAWHDQSEGGDGPSVRPAFRSHLSTLQAAAREFVSIPVTHRGYIDHSENVLKPEWLSLFTLMFHCYFQHMRADVIQDTPPDPLIDALLLLCDCTHFETLSRAPEELTTGFLGLGIGEGIPSSDASVDIISLLKELKRVWNVEKRFKLEFKEGSPMPWSMGSIKEGSMSGKCTYATVKHFS